MRHLDDLPYDVRAAIEALPAELQQAAINLYPTTEQDRKEVSRREALERQRVERRQAERDATVQRALDGAYGTQVRAAAQAIVKRAGADSPTGKRDVVDLVRAMRREKRR